MKHTQKASAGRVCELWWRPARLPAFVNKVLLGHMYYQWLDLCHKCRGEQWCQGPRAPSRKGLPSPVPCAPCPQKATAHLGSLVLQASQTRVLHGRPPSGQGSLFLQIFCLEISYVPPLLQNQHFLQTPVKLQALSCFLRPPAQLGALKGLRRAPV